MQPVVTLSGGMVAAQKSQSATFYFANTVFEYQPHHTSVLNPIVGGFVGAEYAINQKWAWQFGAAFYQASNSSINGEETQAPILNLDATNIWNYNYKILSRQLLFENKLLFTLQKNYHPYLLIGLGEGFNDAHDFHVTPLNSGEVATAIFEDHSNKTFIYMGGLGLDINLLKQMRIGAGYRFAYLGKNDLGKGVLDTGVGGNVFYLPAFKSRHSFSHEALIQLTYTLRA